MRVFEICGRVGARRVSTEGRTEGRWGRGCRMRRYTAPTLHTVFTRHRSNGLDAKKMQAEGGQKRNAYSIRWARSLV